MGLGQKGTYTGIVKRERINVGSKSEHEAIVLDLDTGLGPALKIQLKGDNPFQINPALEQLVGKRVSIQGVAGSGVPALLVEKLSDIKVADPNIRIICSYPKRPRGPGI